MPWVFAAAPETVTCLSAASTLLSLALTVTVPVLRVCRAGTVSTLLPLSVKSPETAAPTAAADTVTVVASLDGWERLAVTVPT